MANNKSFKIKNGLQAGRYLGSNGTETAGTNGPYGTFSTDLYTGNGATQTITNGIDLSGEGGLTWIKIRDGFNSPLGHHLYDTARGATKKLSSNNTDAESTVSTGLTAFNSNGFSLGSNVGVNGGGTGDSYVSWTFKKASNFFDIVTYTGDGTTSRSISHNLGSVPGMIVVKQYQAGEARPWSIYHRGIDSSAPEDYRISFTTAARVDDSGQWNDTAPTSTVFTVGGSTYVNNNGESYVAYLFAHDTSDDGYIQCGSYTGNGSSTGPEINLGWQPSWVMLKRADGLGDWTIFDNVRGVVTGGNDPRLHPSTTQAESSSADIIDFNSTGFNLTNVFDDYNANSSTYIYMAIRAVVQTQTLDLSTGHTFSITPTEALDILFSNPPASGTAVGFTVEVNNTGGYALTWPSSVKWHLGTAPTATASKELYTFVTTDGGTTYYGKLAGSNIA